MPRGGGGGVDDRAKVSGRVVRLRQLMVGSERSESGAHVEPHWGGLETGRRAVARPAILFRALDHLGADRVEDNVPQHLGQVRFLLDEKRLESAAVKMPGALV